MADRYVEARRQGFEAGISLANAIHEAGGHIEYSRLSQMTVDEFITTVAAQNGIRFHYESLAAPGSVPAVAVVDGPDWRIFDVDVMTRTLLVRDQNSDPLRYGRVVVSNEEWTTAMANLDMAYARWNDAGRVVAWNPDAPAPC